MTIFECLPRNSTSILYPTVANHKELFTRDLQSHKFDLHELNPGSYVISQMHESLRRRIVVLSNGTGSIREQSLKRDTI